MASVQCFTIIACEADWPPAYRVNRWVKGLSAFAEANDALEEFTRFPSWVWSASPGDGRCPLVWIVLMQAEYDRRRFHRMAKIVQRTGR